MKKTLKVFSVLFAMFMVTGCFGANTSQSSEDGSSAQTSENVSSNEGSSKSTSQGGGASSSKSSTPSSSKSSSSIVTTPGNFTFNDAELNTVQEIHTANQKSYLEFSGEYYNITSAQLNGFSAKGNSNLSTPNQVTVKWNYTVPTGKTVTKFSVIVSSRQDLSDGFTVNGSTAQQVSFYNAFVGDNYFKVLATLNDGTVEASDVKVFKVTTQAPRNLKVGNLPNCRDTGGRTTVAGGKIKQGLIYRTSGNKFDNRSAPDTEAMNTLRDVLKVKTEINVADNTGYNISVSGTTVKTAFMDYGKTPYSNMSRNSQRIRQVFEILGDENNYPVYYHCRIGTDRTGIVGICLGGLLGIPFNEVMQDYAFSNFAPIDGQRYPHKFAAAETSSASQDGNGDDPAKYIDEILAMPGKNFQEQTYYSLLSLGVPATTLDKVINIMTDGAKATITPYNIAMASNMTLSGGATKKTGGTDYKDPAEYIQISNGKSASFKSTVTAGKKQVVVFLGHPNASDSKKLADGIDLKIDGQSKTIINRNYWRCGFGTTSRTSCTGYMFINLGEYDLTAGEHTFEIAGKNSDTFNLGSIGVFGDDASGGQGGGQGGNEHTTHEYTYGNAIEESGKSTYYAGTCSCGKKAVKWAVNTNTSGQTASKRGVKLSSDGNYFEYKFNYTGTLTGKLNVLAGVDTWDQNQNYGFFYNNAANLEFTVNGQAVTITNTKSYKESGCQEGSDTDESKAAVMEVCAASLKDGENTIRVTRKGSRSATMYEFYIFED